MENFTKMTRPKTMKDKLRNMTKMLEWTIKNTLIYVWNYLTTLVKFRKKNRSSKCPKMINIISSRISYHVLSWVAVQFKCTICIRLVHAKMSYIVQCTIYNLNCTMYIVTYNEFWTWATKNFFSKILISISLYIFQMYLSKAGIVVSFLNKIVISNKLIAFD